MIPNPTRVYKLVTVTPRQMSAMMPSDGKLSCLPGIALPRAVVCPEIITRETVNRSEEPYKSVHRKKFHGTGGPT
jgi:hypothetical protein